MTFVHDSSSIKLYRHFFVLLTDLGTIKVLNHVNGLIRTVFGFSHTIINLLFGFGNHLYGRRQLFRGRTSLIEIGFICRSIDHSPTGIFFPNGQLYLSEKVGRLPRSIEYWIGYE